MKWLPDMDLNHDKQIQSLLCYHYTTRHRGAEPKAEMPRNASGARRFSSGERDF